MIIKVKVNGQVFDVEVANVNERPIVAVVDGEVFHVWPEINITNAPNQGDQAALETPKPIVPPPPPAQPIVLATNSSSDKGIRAVRAPIPGVITSISVQPGSEVSVGQELCKLEAMKMNNSIRANRTGVIQDVNIAIGQHVKHNEILITFVE
jgi:biotin carboxyl carrier protein